jgi:hypothetical protein
MMNVLFVYSQAKFKIESPIEFLGKGEKVETIAPGEQALAPGVYRFSAGVGVSRLNAVNGSVGDAQMLEVPDNKKPWPDPGVMSKVTSKLGVTRDELIKFAEGSGEAVEV